jgi:hypothetical protein
MPAKLKKDLQDLSKALKALAAKVDKMQKQAGKAWVQKAAKGAAVKKAAPEKAAATGVDQVLSVVRQSKKGVGIADIMQKTGFGRKKVESIVFGLRKKGKVKNAGRGVYVKA